MRIRRIWVGVTLLFFCITGIVLGDGVPSAKKGTIVTQMVKDGEIPASCVKDEGPSKLVDIQFLGLNMDGNAEYLITGYGCACQGARRCVQWIYRASRSGVERIFGPDAADSITAKKSATRGWHDIESAGMSGNEVCSITWKFDGKQYREDQKSFRCEAL